MKKLCLVEQGKYLNHPITEEKIGIWQTKYCDYIRFNWYTDEDPNATLTKKDVEGKRLRWSEGRNLLFKKALEDKYDFILYTDEDTVIKDYRGENPHDTLLDFLESYNPAALNIHTTNIWCHDERIIGKIKAGNPCLVRKHDACNSVLRRDIAGALHPIEFHGSDAVTHYQQFLCHILREQYYMSPPYLYAENLIEEQHFHVDDRNLQWQSKIINQFKDLLKEAFKDQWIEFTKNRDVTTDGLAAKEPLKHAPILSQEELRLLFREAK